MKHKSVLFFYLAVFLVFLAISTQCAYAAPPADFQTSLLVGSGLNAPTGLEFAPDGRLFIVEKAGAIKIYKNGSVLATLFAQLPAFSDSDRGLLGIAFDPAFNTNHYVYFYYVDIDDLFYKVVRYNASGDVGTEGPVVIYESDRPAGSNHAGGTIQFGPDGKLYISIGDSGASINAQDLTNPQGKILRINKDGTIPNDNPFIGISGARPEIWAYGFRNPFRFQFDSTTGKLYVGDVGESTWEEINDVARGGNYGWPKVEGLCTVNCALLINPIYIYLHTVPGFAVVGGPVYRSSVFPSAYSGRLFFGDYAHGFISTLLPDTGDVTSTVQSFEPAAGNVTDLKVGPDGMLYYVTIFPGKLYKIAYTKANKIPTAIASADITSGGAPLTVHFSSTGSMDPEDKPLTYSWDFGDGTASTSPNPTKKYAVRGQYIVQLRVSDGVNQALSPALTIQSGTPPTLTINSPQSSGTYHAGDLISYSATAPTATISLSVFLYHNIHLHPFLNNLPGTSGSFVIPIVGESSADTAYELVFTAMDTDGLTTKKSVIVHPITSTLTFRTSPAGLGISVDG